MVERWKKPPVSSVQRLEVFGLPQLLVGEDRADYDEFQARIFAAVKPADMIEEMFVADVLSLEWELLRWRRLKFCLLATAASSVLEDFLEGKLQFDQYSTHFEPLLAEALEKDLPEEVAQDLARQYADDDTPEEVYDTVQALTEDELEGIVQNAEQLRIGELVQAFARREKGAAKLVNDLLAANGKTMDNFFVDALVGELQDIERIDRLETVTGARRNASLRELDRHRATLGQSVRRAVQDIEEGEFRVIEPPPAKKKANG